LAEHAPRLAVSFAVFGLALVGLPGTLSFCSQELLIHGTLQSNPLTGLLLPAATAMNAVSVFRLFTRLFLGKRRTGFTAVVDALSRERWVLAAGMAFVVLGGLFPNQIVAPRAAEAELVERAIRAQPQKAGRSFFPPSAHPGGVRERRRAAPQRVARAPRTTAPSKPALARPRIAVLVVEDQMGVLFPWRLPAD
jgi:NADH:ubiquinone oxidoreductase subunit 5 (subunit L)/multisubunit Na+/H+ antiporter MnhA subunit